MVPADRNTGRVDLCVTGVAKESTPFVGTPGSRDITAHGIGRQEKDVPVTSCAQQYRMCLMGLDRSGNHVPGNNPACMSVDGHQVEHLVPVVHFYGTFVDLS